MYQPLRDIILIEPDKAEKQTSSGFHIAETWKTLPKTGTVKAVGPLVKDIKVGDKVFYERYGAIRIENENNVDTLQACRESHIYGVVNA